MHKRIALATLLALTQPQCTLDYAQRSLTLENVLVDGHKLLSSGDITVILRELEGDLKDTFTIDFLFNHTGGLSRYVIHLGKDSSLVGSFRYDMNKEDNTFHLSNVIYKRRYNKPVSIVYKGNDWKNPKNIFEALEDYRNEYGSLLEKQYRIYLERQEKLKESEGVLRRG